MNLRALPRLFLPGASTTEPIDLPKDELEKLRKVLRLSSGDPILVLPNDGTGIICTFEGKQATPKSVEKIETEAAVELTIAQALPKADKIEEIIRACTELGVARFLLFTAERTVVKWDAEKTVNRIKRFETIARESAEVSFRSRIPKFDVASDLKTVLGSEPDAIVLSELESVETTLLKKAGAKKKITIVVGPEGGWAPREVEAIGDRGVTLGPRVLRVEHAGPAAVAALLLR